MNLPCMRPSRDPHPIRSRTISQVIGETRPAHEGQARLGRGGSPDGRATLARMHSRSFPRTMEPPARAVARPDRGARPAPADDLPAPAAPPRARWSVALAILATALYALGTPRVSADKDSSEFTLVLATLGVAHPTGYPLYTVLGHVLGRALHALGLAWPYAAALWSALAGGVAIGLLHAFTARLLAGRGVPPQRSGFVAALPAVLFAANPLWTLEATVAEVGALHILWLMLALLVTESLARTNDALPARSAHAAGAALGAGLAHHLSSVLWSVPLALVLLPRIARSGARAWIAFVAGALVLPVAGAAF